MNQQPIMSITVSVYENCIIVATKVGNKCLVIEGVDGNFLDKFVKVISDLTKKNRKEPIVITFDKGDKNAG